MCIFVYDYNVILLVNNKSEWYVAMCQKLLLFQFVM
jgi:hypothetical protein